MLIYNPAYDTHHATFRILQILHHNPSLTYERDRLRIFDFILLFPSHLRHVRFPADSKIKKGLFKAPHNPYAGAENPKRLFLEIGAFQDAAINGLIGNGILESSCEKEIRLRYNSSKVPAAIREVVEKRNLSMIPTLDVLVFEFYKMPLLGPDGLKARSSLLEYRYDIA